MHSILKFIFGTSMASVLLFSSPQFLQDDTGIIISGHLKGIFTEKVERIINTGSEVRIIYYISIYAVEKDRTVLLKKRIINSIRHDSLDDIYFLDLNGYHYKTKTRHDAYNRTGFYRAEFRYNSRDNSGFRNFYADASIEYDSSLKSDIPATALWEYYMPYQKISGDIRFQK